MSEFRPHSHPTRGVLVAPQYLLTCHFDSNGPTADLIDSETGKEYRIDAFNRAAFLYAILERTRPDNDGWVSCDVVARAVWGRKASSNNVNTLVYRIRRELKAAGFSADFLEVRRGQIRFRSPDTEAEPLHLSEVELLNTSLAAYREANTLEDRERERKRLMLAIDRVALVPDLYLDILKS